jgi:membrane-bound lytic murein transglycosylase B
MKLISYLFIFVILFFTASLSDNQTDFLNWKKSFKQIALQNDISEKTFDMTMSNVKFLPDVIKYDRYQPEFYEDTKTYILKRTSSKKVSSEIPFSIAVFLKLYFHSLKPIGFSENDGVKEKNIIINK